MVDVFHREKSALLAQNVNNDRVTFPNSLSQQSRGNFPSCAFTLKKAPGPVHWAIYRKAILLPRNIVFLTVTGRSVNGADALFQRHMIGENAHGIAIEKGVRENRALEFRSMKSRRDGVIGPAAFLRSGRYQIACHDVQINVRVYRRVLELRVVGDRQVSRKRPWSRRPDESKDATFGEFGRDRARIRLQGKTNPYRRAFVVFVLDLGFRQRGLIVDAPVNRLKSFIDVALVEKID